MLTTHVGKCVVYSLHGLSQGFAPNSRDNITHKDPRDFAAAG